MQEEKRVKKTQRRKGKKCTEVKRHRGSNRGVRTGGRHTRNEGSRQGIVKKIQERCGYWGGGNNIT